MSNYVIISLMEVVGDIEATFCSVCMHISLAIRREEFYLKDQYFKDEYNNMFFDIYYELVYLKHLKQGIRKSKNVFSNILTGCSIISALSVWVRYYIPLFNFVTITASALTVLMVFIVMKSPYSEQLIYLDLLNKEASELINDIKTQKRNVEYKDLTDSKIQNLIEKFESRFLKLNILYIEPLELSFDNKLTEKCRVKASYENNTYFKKEELKKNENKD